MARTQTNLALGLVRMGRNHFLSIYSVLGNVTLGIAPIGWDLLFDAVGWRAPPWRGLSRNRYTVFFAAQFWLRARDGE